MLADVGAPQIESAYQFVVVVRRVVSPRPTSWTAGRTGERRETIVDADRVGLRQCRGHIR